jgi:hypothetical protein
MRLAGLPVRSSTVWALRERAGHTITGTTVMP